MVCPRFSVCQYSSAFSVSKALPVVVGVGIGGTFEVAACGVFDMFPQTAHVETVVTLARRKG